MLDHHPAFLWGLVVGVKLASQIPQVLASVIEIDTLNRTREVQLGKIPDPFGAVPHHDFLLRTAPAALAARRKDTAQELVYFPHLLLMDRSSRFFSSAVHIPASSSTGRRRQIFSFTAISSALSLWNRRNSSTSRCALRKGSLSTKSFKPSLLCRAPFRKQTVNLIASVLMVPGGDTPTDTVVSADQGSGFKNQGKAKAFKRLNGRPERTRTVDLYRVKVAL